MIIAVVIIGFLTGIASGGTALFVLDLGWLAGLGAFYAGSFLGIAAAALRVAALAGDDLVARPAPVARSTHGIAKAN